MMQKLATESSTEIKVAIVEALLVSELFQEIMTTEEEKCIVHLLAKLDFPPDGYGKLVELTTKLCYETAQVNKFSAAGICVPLIAAVTSKEQRKNCLAITRCLELISRAMRAKYALMQLNLHPFFKIVVTTEDVNDETMKMRSEINNLEEVQMYILEFIIRLMETPEARYVLKKRYEEQFKDIAENCENADLKKRAVVAYKILQLCFKH